MSTAPIDACRTFVLVHGAFHGGWCWRPVTQALRSRGHEVHTPTQTGLGERAHLISGLITMATFVQDIVGLIEMEELRNVVLVGHSYGARPVCGVADRIPHRMKHLVFLDGGLPLEGLSRFESMTPDQQEERARRAEPSRGISVPPPPATAFGVADSATAAWIDRHLTPQPFGAETSRLPLQHPLGNGLPATYVRGIDPPFPVTDASAAFARAQTSWRYLEISAGHEMMITHADAIVDLLCAIP